MTLLTEHLEAGWHEVEHGEFGKWVAERVLSRPGATSSVIRVEAASSGLLRSAISLRQSQLEGSEEPIKDTITNDGSLVTGGQHEALRTDGVVVPGPEAEASVAEVVAAKDAEIESLRVQLAEAQAGADPSEAPATEQKSSGSPNGASSSKPSEEAPPSSPASPAKK